MFLWLLNSLHPILLAVTALVLTGRLGMVFGMTLYLGVVLVTSAAAWQVMRSIQSEGIRWKNYLAGWLLPWTVYVGGGTMQSLLIKNAIASLLFGVAIVTCTELDLFNGLTGGRPAVTTEGTPSSSTLIQSILVWLTALGWIVLLGGWLWLMKSYFSNRSEPISTLILDRKRTFPLLFPPVVLLGCIAMRYLDLPWVAFLLVWVPLMIILSPVLLMLLVIFGYKVAGKPIRWN